MRAGTNPALGFARQLGRLLFLAIALAASGLAVADAATITFNSQALKAAGSARPLLVNTVRLTGGIETGDAEKLREVLERLPVPKDNATDAPFTVIELSSLGGSLGEGFKIGALLRKFRVIAVVRARDICLSACALAFLAGNVHHLPISLANECNVEIGGKVAFHNFWLNSNGLRAVTSLDPVASRHEGFVDARGGAASLAKYAGELGLPANFVASMIGRPVDEYQYIETIEQFLFLRVCPLQLQRPPIDLATQAVNVCRHSTSWADPSLPLDAKALLAPEARRYLLEHLQRDMVALKSKGRLSGQLASGAIMRVKEEIDGLYEDLRAAGVALPQIVGPTFEVGRTRAGAYETVCFVSLSTEDPDNFDVVVRGPKGLAHPAQTPPANSRRLFLFDRSDIVNPRPK